MCGVTLKHVRTHEYTGNADLVAKKEPMSVSWRLNTDDCRVQETRCRTRRLDDVVKFAREQVQQILYIDRVVRENGNFYCSREAWNPVTSRLSWFLR